MEKKQKLARKRRLTEFSLGCGIFSGLLLLGVAVAEQKVRSLENDAREANYLYDRINEDGELAQVVWEFSRVFRNLKDIGNAVDVDALSKKVVEEDYSYTRNLALLFTENANLGFTNLPLGLRTEDTNIVRVSRSTLTSTEDFNVAYKKNQLRKVARQNELIRIWRDSSKQAEKITLVRNVFFFGGNVLGLAALLFSFRALKFEA